MAGGRGDEGSSLSLEGASLAHFEAASPLRGRAETGTAAGGFALAGAYLEEASPLDAGREEGEEEEVAMVVGVEVVQAAIVIFVLCW